MTNALTHLLSFITDVERCVVAGSVNVAGTERLAHHATMLNQLSKQIPALANLAQLTQHFVAAKEQPTSTGESFNNMLVYSGNEAATDLLNLLSQTRALRGAIASTVAPEVHANDFPPSGPWTTEVPIEDLFKELKLVRNNYAHREAIKEGAKQSPHDLRLVNEWLNDAVGNGPSPADLAVDVLLPTYGADVVEDFNSAPFQSTELTKARRLVGLCRIDPEAGRVAILEEHAELAKYL
jgi:hypothetical protein